jgi:hypothetical protein
MAKTITLTYADLKKIALYGEVTRDDVTVKVGSPLIADLPTYPTKYEGYVRFTLDPNDPQAQDAWEEPV